MQVEVWHRTANDKRAPSVVLLEDDYTFAGTVDSNDFKDFASQMLDMSTDKPDLMNPRQPIVGDVAICDDGRSYIFTPSLGWAMVDAIKETETKVLDI